MYLFCKHLVHCLLQHAVLGSLVQAVNLGAIVKGASCATRMASAPRWNAPRAGWGTPARHVRTLSCTICTLTDNIKGYSPNTTRVVCDCDCGGCCPEHAFCQLLRTYETGIWHWIRLRECKCNHCFLSELPSLTDNPLDAGRTSSSITLQWHSWNGPIDPELELFYRVLYTKYDPHKPKNQVR